MFPSDWVYELTKWRGDFEHNLKSSATSVVMNEIIYQSPPQQHGNNKVQHPRGRIRHRRRPLRTVRSSFLTLLFSTNYYSYSTEAFNVLSSTPRLQQHHILYATSNKNNERHGGGSSSGKKKQRQQHSSSSSSKLGKSNHNNCSSIVNFFINNCSSIVNFFNGLVLEYWCWYTANVVKISILNALSIGSGLVVAVLPRTKRGTVFGTPTWFFR